MWQPDPMSKTRRAGGSRTILDVLLHPVDAVTDPSGKKQGDLSALDAGEARSLTCFLRGSASGLPDSFTYGILSIGPGGMTWQRYWRHRREVVRIPPLNRVVEIRRPGGQGERNIKRMFMVVETSGPDGAIAFAVSGVGPELIRHVIQANTNPPGESLS